MRETRSAGVELHPAGCVIVRTRPGIVQTLEDARENVEASVEVGGGPRVSPLLVDIRHIEPLSSEVRYYYVGGALADNFFAVGLLVEASPLGHMLGNVFAGMMNREHAQDPGEKARARVFTDERSAIRWLTTKRT